MPSSMLTVLGDSFSEGRGDPDLRGGYRGWVSRFAAMMNLPSHSIHNFAEYGSTTRYVVREQLPRAIRNKAPLVVVYAGINDLLGSFKSFDGAGLQRNLHVIFDSLAGPSTTVVTANYPNILTNVAKSDSDRRLLREHFSQANAIVAELADVFGASCIDLNGIPGWLDPSILSSDRLHPNSIGHQSFAEELFSVVTNMYGLVAA